MPLPSFSRSLSARLLVLTILFVMLAEVLIYTPSIARFRVVWLEEKLAAGHLAALVVAPAPEGMVTAALERELLAHVGAHGIYFRRPGGMMYAIGEPPPRPVSTVITLDGRGPVGLIVDAFDTMFHGKDRVARIVGRSPRDPAAQVEIVFDEGPLCAAMVDFSWRILGLSIIISLITAGLVFLALRWLTVRPLMRFTEKLMAFRDNPEDADTIIRPGRRRDEVGVAERELHDMQIAVRAALKQKERLAALGTAVTKINHDLRNILTTAGMMSERLTASDDPEVKRTAPRLVDAIDRAAELCSQTLAYTREGGPPIHRTVVDLHHLVDEAEAEATPPGNGASRWVNAVPPGLVVRADREQLLRVLVNLGRNALQAGAGTVTVTAARAGQGEAGLGEGGGRAGGGVIMTVADDGPGLPDKARRHLFQPFASTRRDGTGLGLAIAREIMAAHRGDLRLAKTGPDGTTFRLELPEQGGDARGAGRGPNQFRGHTT